MHHVITYIQQAVENRKLHLSFPRYWGSSDSISRDITKVAKWQGLKTLIVMDWFHAGWQKNYSPSHRNNNGSVAKCCIQRGILLAYNSEAWLQTNSYRDSGMDVIHLRKRYSHQQKFTYTVSSFFRRLWVCNNSGVLKLSYQSTHKRLSTWIDMLRVGTCHNSRNGPFHTVAHTPLSKNIHLLPVCQTATSSRAKTMRNCYLQRHKSTNQ